MGNLPSSLSGAELNVCTCYPQLKGVWQLCERTGLAILLSWRAVKLVSWVWLTVCSPVLVHLGLTYASALLHLRNEPLAQVMKALRLTLPSAVLTSTCARYMA